MNIDDTQKARVREWIRGGAKLSEIQNKLASEFGLRLTYMEARFLMDDLQMSPKDAEPVQSAASGAISSARSPGSSEPEARPEPGPAQSSAREPEAGFQEPGDVTVSVDQVTRAGAVVSGQVKFSDGKSAAWHLDQYGRLAIAPQEQGYKPSQADLMLFQGELQSELGKMGY